MSVVAGQPADEAAKSADPSFVVVVSSSADTYREIAGALTGQGLRVSKRIATPTGAISLDPDTSAIIVFVCNVDVPREMAGLRRLRREARRPRIVVISPPATGTGVRRALDAGADALVFEPEVERALAPTVRAVAIGQAVVPRRLRASVERPVLSHRERQVLFLVGKGLTNAKIAEQLYLAESTIKSHISSIFTKLGVRSRTEAAAAFIELELVHDGPSTDSQGDRSEVSPA